MVEGGSEALPHLQSRKGNGAQFVGEVLVVCSAFLPPREICFDIDSPGGRDLKTLRAH